MQSLISLSLMTSLIYTICSCSMIPLIISVLKHIFLLSELRKPKVSSVGVVPMRTSGNVPGLRVVMEGVPVTEARDVALDEMEEVRLVYENIDLS